jgi:hypothetical protein
VKNLWSGSQGIVEIRVGINHIVRLKEVLNIVVVVRVISIPSKNVLGTLFLDFSEKVAKVN